MPRHSAPPASPRAATPAKDPAETATASPAAEEEERRFLAPAMARGQRLDRFLASCPENEALSRERIKALILAGKVEINGCPVLTPRQSLKEGDALRLLVEARTAALKPESGELRLLYRDEVLAVLNKPAGITVHPAPGLSGGTLANRLLAHFPELEDQGGLRPGIVHRLDKDTSGLMLVALSEECRLALSAMFAERKIFKEYLALCHGVPDWSKLKIKAPLGRDPANKTRMAVIKDGKGGKEAASEARLLHAGALRRFSLVAVRILTGRTHQVRVHMRHSGHPLWGDKVYASGFQKAERLEAARQAAFPGCAKPERQMLHAFKLAFQHPLPDKAGPALQRAPHGPDGEICFICPPPADFRLAARCLSRRCLHSVITGMPGSGKSSLLNLLRAMDLPVFSADACVAALYAPGGDGRRLLGQYYGKRFVPEDEKAPVDKAALGAAMAADPALQREIEALIHPLVWHAMQAFQQEAENDGAALSFAEIPLYLEAGGHLWKSKDDRPPLIGISCPFALRAGRLEEKRGWSRESIARMESWQWPEDKKMRACDLLLDNSKGPEELREQVPALLDALQSRAEQKLEAEYRRLEGLWTR